MDQHLAEKWEANFFTDLLSFPFFSMRAIVACFESLKVRQTGRNTVDYLTERLVKPSLPAGGFSFCKLNCSTGNSKELSRKMEVEGCDGLHFRPSV